MLVHELILQGKTDDLAIVDGSKRITYKDLQAKVKEYRNYFYHIGIRQGENVGLLSRNSAEYIYTYMAIASLGAVVVPINFQLSSREIAYIVKDAEMKHIISYRSLDLNEELLKQNFKQSLKQIIIKEIEENDEKTTLGQAPLLPSDFSEEQTGVIIYTSGTTGNPKGAVLSHKNLTRNAEMFGEVIDVNRVDNVLCILPMYHCFAWTCAVLNPLLSGATIIILDSFNPKETTLAIKQEQVSIIYAVPSIYSLLSRLAEVEDLASVRVVVSGGTTLPVKIADDFTQKFGLPIMEGYGLSEASPVVAVNPQNKVKVGSIGLALPALEVKIVDEAGVSLPTGKIGELIVKGDNVMKGYFNLPQETSQVLKDEWLHTGDMAYQDEDGYIFIVDRLKDMIISMGENIYPREVEELLYAYPGIIEAAVVGVPDKLRGQSGVAFIVMAEGQSLNKRAIKEYLQSNLALYKVPRDFKVMDSLPKSSTGKILKRELAKLD